MSRKWRYRIGACILPLALLAGCGDGTETGGAPSESVGSPVEPVDVSGLVDETRSPHLRRNRSRSRRSGCGTRRASSPPRRRPPCWRP